MLGCDIILYCKTLRKSSKDEYNSVYFYSILNSLSNLIKFAIVCQVEYYENDLIYNKLNPAEPQQTNS